MWTYQVSGASAYKFLLNWYDIQLLLVSGVRLDSISSLYTPELRWLQGNGFLESQVRREWTKLLVKGGTIVDSTLQPLCELLSTFHRKHKGHGDPQ